MTLQYCSAQVQGLGWASKDLNNKACHPVPTTHIILPHNAYTGIYGHRNHVDFVYKEVTICTCVAAKRNGISLEFYCFFNF